MWEEYENIIIGRFGKSKLSDEIKKYAIYNKLHIKIVQKL